MYQTNSSIQELVSELTAAGIEYCYIVTDPTTNELVPSHPQLQPIVDFLADDKVDYDGHEGMFFRVFDGSVMGAFVWKTMRGQACGGIRMRSYDNVESYIRDGMRLAIGMGRKSALAGLWWGGGKGVVAHPNPTGLLGERRTLFMNEYGKFLTTLRGCYVAAEDAGITVADVDKVFATTRFTTCISPALGGSGNPSVPTAHGIVCGMEAALDFLGMGSLEGKTVAIQGCGNVGSVIVGILVEKKIGKVVACDVDQARLESMRAKFAENANVEIHNVNDGIDIFAQEADILSPCAYGGVINEENVAKIKAKIVCGAANNQFLDPKTDCGMHARGIWYCPDFVVNRMGIVNCANEHAGHVGKPASMNDPLVTCHLEKDYPNGIYQTIHKIFKKSQEENESPSVAADLLADEMAAQHHPIFGHRGQLIISSLMQDKWEQQ